MSKLAPHNLARDHGPVNYEGLNMKSIVCVAALIISISTSYANESPVSVETPLERHTSEVSPSVVVGTDKSI